MSSDRIAFKMKILPGKQREYRNRHDEIWPELSDELREAGVRDYTIFLDSETNTLFASYELSPENNLEALPEKEIMKKWWKHMADIMEVNSDNSPVVTPLSQVFYHA
jgi:L-rhamnose mutarotase